jgi:hypothetical protein
MFETSFVADGYHAKIATSNLPDWMMPPVCADAKRRFGS